MINLSHLNAFSPALNRLLDQELEAGNAIQETYKGWPEHDSVGVVLTEPFKTISEDDASDRVIFHDLKDHMSWEAEFVDSRTHHILASPLTEPRTPAEGADDLLDDIFLELV